MADANQVIDQLTNDPEFLTLPEQDQDALVEEFLGAGKLESRIAERESLIPLSAGVTAGKFIPFTSPRRLATASVESLATPIINPIEALRRGHQSVQSEALRQLAGQEAVESVTAAPILAMMQGKPVLSETARALKGERVVERGDIFRQAGVPEPLAAMAGVVTDPLAILGARPTVHGLGRGVGRTGEFFRGNVNKIRQSEQALETTADAVVTSIRKGGKLHGRFLKALSDQADEAWEPMKQLGREIQNPIPFQDIRRRAVERVRGLTGQLESTGQEPIDDTVRLIDALIERYPNQQSILASDLIDEMTNLGQTVRRAVKSGKARANEAERAIAGARSVIADTLSNVAPSSLQNAVSTAWSQWGEYATVADDIHRILSPNAPRTASTVSGVNFLKRASEGKLLPSETRLLQRIEQNIGQEISEPLARQFEKIQKLRGQGSIGRRIGQVATRAPLYYASFEILRRLFGPAVTQMADLSQ